MSEPASRNQAERRYPTSKLVQRLLALASQFRADFLCSRLFGLAGLQLLGLVIGGGGLEARPAT